MKTTISKIALLPVGIILLFLVVFVSRSVSADTSDTATKVETVTATINYYYYDETAEDNKGTQPYTPFVANMPKGSTEITEKSPTVLGYSPYYCVNGEWKDATKITVSFKENSVINVFYKPSEVSYTIRLFKQNLEDDNYQLEEIINRSGLTGTEPKEFEEEDIINKYEGYTLMYHVPDTIAADGSTEFECYYDRNYYLIDVDLVGGHGVEPIYAKYGSRFTMGTPSRTGYEFDGWTITKKDTGEAVTGELTTIPSYNVLYTAKWKVKEATYRVIYKNADVSDGSSTTTYSYWGTEVITKKSNGSNITAGETLTMDEILNEISGPKTLNLTDADYFTFDENATGDQSITVAGDGSTTVTMYYSRNSYTIRFVYARQDANVSNLVDGEYIIVNQRAKKALDDSQYSNTGRLSMSSLDVSSNTTWSITKQSDGTYTIQNSGGKYLTIGSSTSNVTSNKTSLTLEYSNDGTYWSIGQNGNYLNDWGGSGANAGGYGNIDAGSKWSIYSLDGTAETSGTIQGSNSTGIGDYSSDSMHWNYTFQSVPTLKSTMSNELTTGTTIASDGYKLYYIDLTAEYGANIENIWPADVVDDATDTSGCIHKFGSWATEYGTTYRNQYDVVVSNGDQHSNVVGAYPTMSAEMIKDPTDSLAQTMYAWWGAGITSTSDASHISEHRYEIYYQTLPDEEADVTKDNVNYKLDRTLVFQAAHNGNTRVDPFFYDGFEIIDSQKKGVESSTSGDSTYDSATGIGITKFYYNRKSYNIEYFSVGDIVRTESSVLYGADITGYGNYTPDYPSTLPAGKYEFGGWYTSNDVHDDSTKFDWGATMPSHDVAVYAYWKPKEYTVNFYNSENDYLNNATPVAKLENVAYNSIISDETALGELTAPTFKVGDSLESAKQAGWFYYDDSGVLHAFDVDAMTVSGDLNLFMTWTTTIPVQYTVHYVDTEENQVAPDTVGYSFVGLTKTFKAKTDAALNAGYQTNYFPNTESSSILMQEDSDANVITFTYTKIDYMPYVVKYLEAGTNKELHPEKNVSDNEKAAVTEHYLPLEGYVPDAYYKTLTLTMEKGHNVIIFYYTKDETNMPLHIKYLLEDENGSYKCLDENSKEQEFDGKALKFTQFSSIDSTEARGSTKDISLIDYEGYAVQYYQVQNYVATAGENSYTTQRQSLMNVIGKDGGSVSVTLAGVNDSDVKSQEIWIYYTKKSYPVKVTYELKVSENIQANAPERVAAWVESLKSALGSDKLIPSNDTDVKKITYKNETYYTKYQYIDTDQKYNSTYTAEAPTLAGFNLAGNPTQSILVKVEDDTDPKKNVISYSYTIVENVMFYYKAVFPDDEANHPIVLNINQQSVEVGARPTTTAEAQITADKYVFAGWYTDPECKNAVTEPSADTDAPVLSGEQNQKLKPMGANVDTTYYAKYVYQRGSLTIDTSFKSDEDSDETQSFTFVIKGADSHNSDIELEVCIEGAGSKTIQDLPVGNYTIEQTDWSWRYDGKSGESQETKAEVKYKSTTTVEYQQTMNETKWLDGNGYKDNVFDD